MGFVGQGKGNRGDADRVELLKEQTTGPGQGQLQH